MLHEEWRGIPGWPYEASSAGRVRRAAPGASTRNGRVLRALASHSGGYPQVRLSRGARASARTFCVHQLVALAFYGPLPDGWHTNHINCDKTDNRPTNLEYILPGDNVRHAIANGRRPPLLRGEMVASAKLTDNAVRTIRTTQRTYGAVTALARRFRVDRNTIYGVLNGATWTHVE